MTWTVFLLAIGWTLAGAYLYNWAEAGWERWVLVDVRPGQEWQDDGNDKIWTVTYVDLYKRIVVLRDEDGCLGMTDARRFFDHFTRVDDVGVVL